MSVLSSAQAIAAQNNYLADYLYRFSNDECHPDFHFWSSMTLLGHIVGTRVWINHGRFAFRPCLLTIQVGQAGSGKSTAKDEARNLFVELFPNQLISEDIETREYLIREMTDNACFWKHPNEIQLREYHPLFLLVDEFADWISVNPPKMLGFLIGTFMRPSYGAGFKKDKELGLPVQRFPNPLISMIACAQPEWFLANIKTELFTRGLGRRCIILKREPYRLNDKPICPADSEQGWLRVKAHLRKLGDPKFFGELKKTPEAEAWYTKWHNDPSRKHRYDDPMLNSQLLDTQHVLLYKVASLYAMTRYDFDFTVTMLDFTNALARLRDLETEIAKLMSTVGKNEMAPVASMMIQAVEAKGGMMKYTELLMAFFRHGRDLRAFNDGLNFLCTTKQLYDMPKLQLPGMSTPVRYLANEVGLQKLREKGVKLEFI
jgi:hypothetical protein